MGVTHSSDLLQAKSQQAALFTAGKFHPRFSPLVGTMTEGEFNMILIASLTGILLVAVVALLCYFTCRLATSLPLGGPGTF